jgi:hypothetical protein
MSTARTCPDWPALLEVAPDLHFKHYTLAEARLPAEVLVNLPDVPRDAITICVDLEQHVVNTAHTDPRVTDALHGTYWFELSEWVAQGPHPA